MKFPCKISKFWLTSDARVFRQTKTPKGVHRYQHPLIFAFLCHLWKIFLVSICSGSRNSTVIMKNDIYIAWSWKSRSNTFRMRFFISGCKHDTKLISMSILKYSRSRMSKMWNKFTWSWRLTFKLEITHTHCMTFLISGCIHAANLFFVIILTF